MHFHLEIIMPPAEDVEAALQEIMNPFDENSSHEENDDFSGHPFWDWWTIGGRWSGAKIEAKVGADKLKEFKQKLTDMDITISGLVYGKQEISPANQIPAVDALWNEMFPDSGSEKCTLFQHSGSLIDSDICRLDELPDGLMAAKVIIAAPQWYDKIGAENMFSKSLWNGVTHEKTRWDGNVKEAIEMHLDKIKNYKEEARDKYMPKPDWLCVTIDYHS